MGGWGWGGGGGGQVRDRERWGQWSSKGEGQREESQQEKKNNQRRRKATGERSEGGRLGERKKERES